jgi:serine/threonine protein kinase
MEPSSPSVAQLARVCEVGRLYAGQYLVKAVLGVGGMAEVYLVEHQTLRADFALKVLRPELRQRPDMVQRFRSESRALWELSHPSFVRVHHAGDDPALGPFMVMEVLRGKTLYQTLKRNRTIEVSHAIGIGIEIANACEAMHRLGIIHRDLKPDNIFLTLLEPQMTHGLKLLDLGAAKIAKYGDPATAANRQIGTGKYMSPEHIRGEVLGPPSDVYSLGHILFETISGTPVFGLDHPNPTHLEYQVWHLQAQHDRLSARIRNIPPGLDEAIWQAMQKQPAHRFQSMAAFAAALQAVLTAQKAARLKGGTEQMDATLVDEEKRLLDALMAPSTDGKWSYPLGPTASAPTHDAPTVRNQPAPAVDPATMESAMLRAPRPSPATMKVDTGFTGVPATVAQQPMADLETMLASAPRARAPATQAMATPQQWSPPAQAAPQVSAPAPPQYMQPIPKPPVSAHARGSQGSNTLVIVAIVLAAIAIAGFVFLKVSGRL